MRPGYLLSVLFVAMVAVPPALGAMEYTETWSDDGDLEGWYPWASVMVLSHNDTLDTLDWEGIGSSSDYINADASSSGGAFVGDLRPFQGGFFSFDFYLAEGSSLVSQPSAFALDLFSGTQEWMAYLTPPQPGEWVHYHVPLIEAAWTPITPDGRGDWNDLLANTLETAVSVWWESDSSGRLDNFRLGIPEPSTWAMFGVGAVAVLLWRRRGKR